MMKTHTPAGNPDSLSYFLWLVIPAVFLTFQIGLEVTLSFTTLSRLLSEGGPHEAIQAVLMSAAFILAAASLKNLSWKSQSFLCSWAVIAALGCLYVTGEEISWGQQILQWNTPAFWNALNDQQETNLHNTTSWLDQKPKLLLELGVYAGALIIPALVRFCNVTLPTWLSLIRPARCLLVPALFMLLLRAIEVYQDLSDTKPFVRISEVMELYLYYFIFLYMVIFYRRTKAWKTA